MTPLQTSTGVLPGTDRDGRRSGVLPGAGWDGRPERRVSRADWDRRPSGRRSPEWQHGERLRGAHKTPLRPYSPSVTTITRSAGRSWRVCFSPLGQWTSSDSTRVLPPNPKLTR